MSDSKRLSKSMPETEGSFELDVRGDTTNQPFRGTFRCKILTRKDRASVAKHRAFLNGPLEGQLDLGTLTYHYMVAYLRFALTEYPKFWEESDLGYDLYDTNVVEEVYKQVMKFEEDWMREVWGEERVEELKREREDQAEAG